MEGRLAAAPDAAAGPAERAQAGASAVVHPSSRANREPAQVVIPGDMELRLSEVVAALSHALDITHGQPDGHAARSCLLGMRIADAIGLGADARSALFYALLLKDAGCSTNAAQMASMYDHDDHAAKRDWRRVDNSRLLETVGHALRTSGSRGGPMARLRRVGALARHGPPSTPGLYGLRCERGAEIARMIGLDEAAAEAIRHLEERWDGSGYPDGLAGAEISPLGRILCLSQTMEVFWQDGGRDGALAVARRRRGTWFEPALVDALDEVETDAAFWASLEGPRVTAIEPADRVIVADDRQLDRIAEAFARVVDAKSPYTGRHSEGVAEIAVALGERLGLDAEELRTLRRAGLLHDLGKLAISNLILDKPGKLTPEEWDAMRAHPGLSERILERVPAFAAIARIAGNHHERLDGSGYPRGRTGLGLDLPSRILAVADVAEALSAERPYRPALGAAEVLEIMRRDAGTRLDAAAFAALEAYLPERAAAAEPAATAAP
jgi:HD-GYP domain-containing protein (c-di-GMP phosphodiesterase class II)